MNPEQSRRMKNLFGGWADIEDRILEAKEILVFLDYDGTLSPIAPRPEDAGLDGATKKVLVSLSRKKNTTLGIVSGRTLSNIKKLVGIGGIYYAGNHGLEIKGPGIRFIPPAARRSRPCIKKIKKDIDRKIKRIKGAILEDKGLTLTLHYRLVKKKDLKLLKDIFNRICRPYAGRKRIRVSSGKRSWEIRPPVNWNKGSAVKKILAQFHKRKIFSIYIGDDLTDEDAFCALKKSGLTVFVGKPKKRSCAEYNLRSVSEVKRFLKKLIEL